METPQSATVSAPSTGSAQRATSTKPWSSGLEDTVAAATRLSAVDGERGSLLIGGTAVEDIVDSGFVAVAARLLARAGADAGDGDVFVHATFAARFRAARPLMWRRFARESWLALDDPMAALRVGLSFVSGNDPADFIAASHAIVAAWVKQRAGNADLNARAPDDHDDDHDDDDAASAGAWLLKKATGTTDAEGGAALDRYLTTVIDHGMNASTFVARVTASTQASLSASLTAGVAALSGPLHGGAPGPVLDLLDQIAAGGFSVIDDELAAGRRLMGFGHRIYRVRDPRAAVLERAVARLAATNSNAAAATRLTLARQVELEAGRRLAAKNPDRALPANVEFFTAVLLEAVGLLRTAFAAIFAAGRVAGWCAHVVEQRRTGRLIRPQSLFVP
jgi:citrate synthase